MSLQLTRMHWIALFVILFLVGGFLNFNSSNVVTLLVSTFIFAGFFLLAIRLLLRKSYIKLVGLLLFGGIIYLFSGAVGGLCATAITPDHFRTNIITNQCDFGGYSGCVSSDPWYFTPDCASGDAKLNAIEGTDYNYSNRLGQCERLCESGSQGFCTTGTQFGTWGNGPADIDCETILACETITCSL